MPCVVYSALLNFFLSGGDSSSGRTTDSESVSIGSNPISPANFHETRYFRHLRPVTPLVNKTHNFKLSRGRAWVQAIFV